MSLINSLVEFVSGTKALASEVNQNFETLRLAHNNQETRVNTAETNITNLQSKTGNMFINIKEYGATGDGVTDDTTSIQNAITAAKSNDSSIFIPAGEFVVSSSLDVSGIDVYGTGRKSIIQASSAEFDVITTTGSSYLKDFYIHGGWDGSTAGQSGNSIHVAATSPSYPYHVHIENVIVQYSKENGIYIKRGGYSSIKSVKCNASGLNGLELKGTNMTSDSCTTISVDGSSVFSDTPNGYAIKMNYIANINIMSAIMEYTKGIYMGGDMRNVNIFGCYQENTSRVTLYERGDGNNQMSSWTITGETLSNTDGYKLYWTLTDTAGTRTVSLYKDSAKTQLVAQGTGSDGVITLNESNSSGLSGSVTVAYTGDDTNSDNVLYVAPSFIHLDGVGTGLNVIGNYSTDMMIAYNDGYRLVNIFGNTNDGSLVLPESHKWNIMTSFDSSGYGILSVPILKTLLGFDCYNSFGTSPAYKLDTAPLSGFDNYLLDLYNNGTSKFKVDSTGGIVIDWGDYDGGHIRLGNYHLWVDTSGKLRIKNGTPSSSTDGTVVGSQS